MLKLPVATKQGSINDITSRNTYITGIIKEIQDNGKYKVEILSSGKEFPGIFPNDPNITYTVDDVVGILWEYGCREKPIIVGKLRAMSEQEATSGTNALGL